MMKPELGSEIECSGPSKGSDEQQPDPARDNLDDSDWLDRCYTSRVRESEAKGFAVYTRKKRLKSAEVGATVCFEKKNQSDSRVLVTGAAEAGAVVGRDDVAGNVGGVPVSQEAASAVGRDEGDEHMIDVEIMEEPIVVSNGARRLTFSIFRAEEANMNDFDSEDLRDAVILEADDLLSEQLTVFGSPEARKMAMKMSRKIMFKERPTTVRELFETGLLEGYPVFYNGGKRGFPLRGTIKESGILCSCSLCQGMRVVPPCQFEIHACRSYRRASQYICLENGKSLLDVVKECRKSSIKSLEETLQDFVGPMPVKESVICHNCGGPFLATSSSKIELLCDSCMIELNSDFDVEYAKPSSFRPLGQPLGLSLPQRHEMNETPLQEGHRGRKKIKRSEMTTAKAALLVHKKKSKWKIKDRFLPSVSAMNPNNNTLGTYSVSSPLPLNGSACLDGSGYRKILKKLSKVKLLSKPMKDESASDSGQSVSRITKKDQRMHKLVFESGGLPDGTEVAYYSNGKKLREGYKMGSGIVCRCCSTLVSPSQFECHAGWSSRRKPYMYIYTSNGVSLHEYALSLLKGRKGSLKDNDDLCIICADGGDLVLCDGCPRSFHRECASLSSVPDGKWYCTYCQNMFEREKFVMWNANAVAAGRVSGVDPIEQITNRCIRIVKNPEEADVIACVICRGYDFSKSGFGPRTVILCDQCEKEYHVGCLKKCKLADLKELPKGKWFCSDNCRWIYSALQNLLHAGPERIPDPSLDILKNRRVEYNSGSDIDFDIRWRLMSGKLSSRETRVLLSQAVAIFHECFDPIVDSETGRDFIPSLVYGRNIRGHDFSGMHCAILTVNSTVVSAGILRIFGEEIAELPLAATRTVDQGKGYFQLLYSCIEKLLAFLNIKTLVLPATDEARSIWTDKFGFEKIPLEQLMNYRRTRWQIITFKGTSMLEKPVPRCRIINQIEESSDVVEPNVGS